MEWCVVMEPRRTMTFAHIEIDLVYQTPVAPAASLVSRRLEVLGLYPSACPSKCLASLIRMVIIA